MYLNKVKLQRAIALCGKDASEEEIKAAYTKLGGALEGELYTPLDTKTVVIETPEEAEVVLEPVAKKVKKPLTRILRKK